MSQPAQLRQIKLFLEQRDFVSLGDTLLYETCDTTASWLACIEAVRKLVDFPLIARSGLKFAHEALFGVGAGCFDQLLAGTSCRVTTLNGEHDVNFGGFSPEPVPRNYARSSAFLKRHPHDLCLVTDGDADRVGGMDGHGRPLSTHQIICLLLHHFAVNRKGRGRVVKGRAEGEPWQALECLALAVTGTRLASCA